MNKRLLLLCLMFFYTLYTHGNQFILITTLYNEINQKRCEEYITCLEKNLAHPLIEKIHVVYDTSKDNEGDQILLNFLQTNEIEISYISGRATYQNCFEIANNLYPNRRVIVANGDIYFNDTLKVLVSYNFENKFLALTRWEINSDGSLRKQYGTHGRPLYCSQDAWIFCTPLRPFENADIQLGILGCDATIAKQALLAGLQVLNPCLTVQCVHLHFTNLRHYPTHGYPSEGYYEVKWDYLY